METAVFLLFALLAVGSSVMVVTHRNPVYSTLSLVVTLFSVAVLFVLLGAPFLAALQILIYAGAIVVLFLFVLMLLNIQAGQRDEAHGQAGQRWAAILGAAVFCGMLGTLIWRTRAGVTQAPLTEHLVSLRALASQLFSEYLLAFEIVGLLLLAAVIGATLVARRPDALDSLAQPMPEISPLAARKAGDAISDIEPAGAPGEAA